MKRTLIGLITYILPTIAPIEDPIERIRDAITISVGQNTPDLSSIQVLLKVESDKCKEWANSLAKQRNVISELAELITDLERLIDAEIESIKPEHAARWFELSVHSIAHTCLSNAIKLSGGNRFADKVRAIMCAIGHIQPEEVLRPFVAGREIESLTRQDLVIAIKVSVAQEVFSMFLGRVVMFRTDLHSPSHGQFVELPHHGATTPPNSDDIYDIDYRVREMAERIISEAGHNDILGILSSELTDLKNDYDKIVDRISDLSDVVSASFNVIQQVEGAIRSHFTDIPLRKQTNASDTISKLTSAISEIGRRFPDIELGHAMKDRLVHMLHEVSEEIAQSAEEFRTRPESDHGSGTGYNLSRVRLEARVRRAAAGKILLGLTRPNET